MRAITRVVIIYACKQRVLCCCSIVVNVKKFKCPCVHSFVLSSLHSLHRTCHTHDVHTYSFCLNIPLNNNITYPAPCQGFGTTVLFISLVIVSFGITKTWFPLFINHMTKLWLRYIDIYKPDMIIALSTYFDYCNYYLCLSILIPKMNILTWGRWFCVRYMASCYSRYIILCYWPSHNKPKRRAWLWHCGLFS